MAKQSVTNLKTFVGTSLLKHHRGKMSSRYNFKFHYCGAIITCLKATQVAAEPATCVHKTIVIYLNDYFLEAVFLAAVAFAGVSSASSVFKSIIFSI